MGFELLISSYCNRGDQCTGTQDCLQALAQLGNMPQLHSLMMTKSLTKIASSRQEQVEFAEPGKLERLLAVLKQHCTVHPGLRSVQILAMEDEVILSRCKQLLPF